MSGAIAASIVWFNKRLVALHVDYEFRVKVSRNYGYSIGAVGDIR